MLMALGMGMCINNARAVLEALVGHQSSFRRTPKYGVTAGSGSQQRLSQLRQRYAGNTSFLLTTFELFMACYFLLALHQAWSTQLYLALPFLLLFQIGFAYSSTMSLLQPLAVPPRL